MTATAAKGLIVAFAGLVVAGIICFHERLPMELLLLNEKRGVESHDTNTGVHPPRENFRENLTRSVANEQSESHGVESNDANKPWPSRLVTTLNPLWPGKPFKFACPKGTNPDDCAHFGNGRYCFEPEHETQEVLNSFLINCPGCLYVDIGCNAGYFAAHAAVLGAHVECYEPTPNFCDAIKATGELNDVSSRLVVHNAGIGADEEKGNAIFDSAYSSCGLSFLDPQKGIRKWKVPVMPIREVVFGRNVTLLKIDNNAHAGAILHWVASMIMKQETRVDAILVQLGEGVPEWHCGDTPAPGYEETCPGPNSPIHPRGGDIEDVYRLQKYGYDLYRISIHVGREIFDWRGVNVNQNMAPKRRKGVIPMFGVRNMRKLEYILPSRNITQVGQLFRWGTSFLLTRVRLAELAKHHEKDLETFKLDSNYLNAGNPVLRR